MEVTTGGGSFVLRRLSRRDLDRVAALCDQCVGVNLYPRDFLASILNRTEHYFYLLLTQEGELAGYIYFYLTNLEEMVRFTGLPAEALAEISPKRDPVIGNLQSIAVAPAYRGQGLSVLLTRFYLDQLRLQPSVDAAFGLFWEMEGSVPMERTLRRSGFSHLTDAHQPWFGIEALRCPLCRGRCRCDGAVYYRNLKGEDTA